MENSNENIFGDLSVPGLNSEELSELYDLYSAILTMKTPEELNLFFRDLCSVSEMHSFLHRWQIVRRIDDGKSYEEIIRELTPEDGNGKTTVSSTTISRVKNCYINDKGGYRTALDRLKGE